MAVYRQTRIVLQQIEAELRAMEGWHEQAPPPAALQSRQPFCVDTLSFTQWVQFVLLPKMTELVLARAPLPTNIAVAPMAEEALKHQQPASGPLISRLAELDQLLSVQ